MLLKLKEQERYVANYQQMIFNKDGKIDRQSEEIEGLNRETSRLQALEQHSFETEELRDEVSRLDRLASNRILLIKNLEGQCLSLSLQNRDPHSDRCRLSRSEDEAETTYRCLKYLDIYLLFMFFLRVFM